jgi:hypothetical protein
MILSEGPVIFGPHGAMVWSAPIDYGSVVFDGAGLFPSAGTFYHDASARKNHGTLVNGPTWTWVPELGRWGVLHDKAIPQYVTISGLGSLSGYVSTVAFWINLTSYDGAGTVVLSTTNGAGAILFWQIGSNVAGVFIGGNNEVYESSSRSLSTWYHYALVAESQTVVKCYRNGVLTGTNSSASVVSLVAGAKDWTIGKYINGASWDMDGTLADVAIFNTALSPPQIQWLANRGPQNNPWQPWRRKSWAVTGGTPAAVTFNATALTAAASIVGTPPNKTRTLQLSY